MKVSEIGKKLGLRSLRRRYALVGCVAMIVVALLLGWRQWSVRDISQGRSFLRHKKYGSAVREFKTELSRRKYRQGARGLLLFSMAMEHDYRRPILAITGVDGDGLIRLVAFQSLRGNPGAPKNHPVIRDIRAKSDRAAVQVRRHLKKLGIHTRDWADAETVLGELAGAVWANTDAGLVDKNDPERLMLDFASMYLALKGGPRTFRARAHRYLINRLPDRDTPLDAIALVHNTAFIEMLETESSGARASGGRPAMRLLYRHRLYKKLEWISNKHKLMPETAALRKREPESAMITNSERNGLLKQRAAYKPFEEMASFHFDPTAIHWREQGGGGAPAPLQWFVWIYGTRADGRNFDMVYVLTQNIQLELLRFDHGKKLTPAPPIKGRITEFDYCAKTRELAFKTETEVSASEVVDAAVPAKVATWHPFRADLENLTLKSAGEPRDAPCL